ncbi:ABC transporter substrate-binding protein [Catellatospora citrea]|uniref:Sulfonate ABC transporter substrate-binding protein n=1 Tax=Catellatospora citrea TaxID=53366 RepID=A0A8J3P0Z0_9ACTN|nr:ABC transporter substrate-binding protein [Catellatospora citrea]RKE07753.1 NitT/TauT family transport system substrate-binding protein [Catellatospora citrea]GIF99341.1 sulfonate ABC transporter substrate-binding protein [Catellatospora citrea]
MNRRSLHRLAAVTAVAALVLPATACGGSDDPAPGAPATVVLGFSAWPGWFPWQVAQEQGLFAKNGVTVELKYFDSYTDSLTALATGNLSANSQTLGDTLTSISGGAQQTIVLVNDNSTGNDQIIAKPGINTVADLKGKRVAVEQGTVDHYLLLLALKTAGLTEADIALKPMLTDAGAAAFTTGEVDAVGAFAPFTTTALGLAGSKAIATSADFPGAIPDHLVFTAAFVKDHPTEVQAVVKTWFDTLAWIKANPDAAIDIMAKKAGVSAADYKSYDAGTTIFTREQNLAAFTPGSTPANLDFQAKSIAEFMVSAKLVDSAPPLDGLLEPKFVQAVSP